MGVAVVTGASSGIGRAIYDRIRMWPDLEAVIGVSRRGPVVFADLGGKDAVQEIVGEVDGSRVSLLVNCAGIMPLPEEGREEEIMRVNFWAPVWVTDALLPALRKGTRSDAPSLVLNIASVAGMRSSPETPVYGASKAALLAYTASMARRHAPRIRFAAISPGFVRTNLVPGETPPELLAEIPMHAEAEPKALLQIVEALWATPYVTGSNFVVDGGLLC